MGAVQVDCEIWPSPAVNGNSKIFASKLSHLASLGGIVTTGRLAIRELSGWITLEDEVSHTPANLACIPIPCTRTATL